MIQALFVVRKFGNPATVFRNDYPLCLKQGHFVDRSKDMPRKRVRKEFYRSVSVPTEDYNAIKHWVDSGEALCQCGLSLQRRDKKHPIREMARELSGFGHFPISGSRLCLGLVYYPC